ncbi:hypothetical protein EDB89DRAFT_2017532 [Lactarius sanguifluus]|nr:hypothetical protein EDB89DRAFT_2017532 [Lactarius sanguifluus]
MSRSVAFAKRQTLDKRPQFIVPFDTDTGEESLKYGHSVMTETFFRENTPPQKRIDHSFHSSRLPIQTIDLANLPQPVPMLGFGPALVQYPSKASKRTREYDSEPRRRRPFLFETLRALASHPHWRLTTSSGLLCRKVLAEESSPDLTRACGNNVSGCSKYQKTRLLKELLDAVLEQFLAELGNALLEFVDGTHCTILDPREHSADPCVLLAKARSLIARFERLGRDRDTIMVAIPATEAGIAAAASLQCEDGINVNLTSVSGVMHAAACAQAGAAAVTMSIAAIRNWHRDRGRVSRGVTRLEENTGAGDDNAIGDAQTIAAYFQQHGIFSTQLLACKIGHVNEACSLAALGALSFDADQARAAEWYDGYPHVPRTIPDSATRRAASFSSPLPLDPDERGRARRAQRTLKCMDAEALSAYSAVVYAALGSGRAAMSMIADIAKREIDWQLALLRPMKRTCRAPEALRVPDAHSPRKRSKLASGEYCYTAPENEEADEGDGDGEWGDEEDEDAPTRGGRLWQRLAPASERNEENPVEEVALV